MRMSSGACEREVHLPPVRERPVLHVGHVVVVEQERPGPPHHQQHTRQTDGERVPGPGAVDPHQREDQRRDRHEDQHDAVRDGGGGDHDRRPDAVLAGAQAVREQPERQHTERQGDRERELAGHRRLEVAAVDAEALVESEREATEREHLGDRMPERSETTERPTRCGQGDQAEHGNELHRHAVRQHQVDEQDRERR